MTDAILNVGSPVKDFVKKFLQEAEEGIRENGFVTCSESEAHSKIELSAVETKEAEGSLKIRVLSLGGKKQDENTQKMTIFAKKIDDAEEAEKLARIEKAKTEEEFAKRERNPSVWIA